MNEQLEKQLAILIEKSIAVAEQTGEFVIEQGNELIQQFFTWHITENILSIVFSLLTLYVLNLISKNIGTKISDWDYEEESHMNNYINFRGNRETAELMILTNVPIGIAAIILIFKIVFCIKNITFLIVAPKLYLIEYFL